MARQPSLLRLPFRCCVPRPSNSMRRVARVPSLLGALRWRSCADMAPPPPPHDAFFDEGPLKDPRRESERSRVKRRGGEKVDHRLVAHRAFDTVRQRLEENNTDGITAPPPGTELLPMHVWCGICQVEVSYGGGAQSWQRHEGGSKHRSNAHRHRMEALKATAAATAAGRKPSARRVGLAAKPGLRVGP